MRKRISIAAALLIALLVVTGCPGTPGSADNPLPDWFANKTWTGTVKEIEDGVETNYQKTITTGMNDLIFSSGDPDVSGIKNQMDEEGLIYYERIDGNTYTLQFNETETVGEYSVTTSTTIKFTKTGDLAMDYNAVVRMTGTTPVGQVTSTITEQGSFTGTAR